MKSYKKIVLGVMIAASFVILYTSLITTSVASPDSESGWFPAGSHPKDYKMEITDKVKHSGSSSAMIKFTSDKESDGFGTFMQMHKPGAWAGKKIKMTGFLKSEDVKNWSGMWCRVDAASGKESFDFDNMGDRPIKGTTDWKKYEITVNVPSDASAVAYGVLLNGGGTVYFDDIAFEVLGAADAEPHNGKMGKKMPDKPANLNFETK
jgi:hypothetical protein